MESVATTNYHIIKQQLEEVELMPLVEAPYQAVHSELGAFQKSR